MSAVLSAKPAARQSVLLSEVVQFNPKPMRNSIADELEVSFVPMAAVEAGSGRMHISQTRQFSEVKKGFTHFRDGDVLFAKITPCMENGKMAVAGGLRNGIGYGSTEFHVLRPSERLDARYLYCFVSSRAFRREAAHHMTGAVGLRRVPISFLEQTEIPIPSMGEQRLVVAEIEKQFSRLDEAAANLQRVKANLRRYTHSVLEEAFAAPLLCTLGDVIAFGPQNGLYLPKSDYGSGTPILRIDDYQTDWCRAAGELRQVRASADQIKAWALAEGDVVINRVNSTTHLGKCLSASAGLAGVLFESNMMRMSLRGDVSPRYVELYLGSKTGRARLTANAKWAVNQASINQQDVRATPMPLLPLVEQHRIVAEVDRRLSIARGVEAQVDANLKRAQALRQAVLAKAFGGAG